MPANEQSVSVPSVCQLRVVVRGVSPVIWRRLLVPAHTTIGGLHAVLQIRSRVLNDTLADDYRRWYPGFTHTDRQGPSRMPPTVCPALVDSPRWWSCACTPRPAARTFSPLVTVLGERTTPELSYLQARFAGLVSYGLSADLLSEILPLGRALHATTVRRQLQATAQRMENELGDERPTFITGCPADWAELPRPDLPLVVGLDGGYVHSSTQRTRRDGWFEVIAGRAMPADGRPRCFGYVQTYDRKPKRRLFEVLASQGMQPNQQVTFESGTNLGGYAAWPRRSVWVKPGYHRR